jgi:hypothetical protein
LLRGPFPERGLNLSNLSHLPLITHSIVAAFLNAHCNAVYRFFRLITSPVVKGVRVITPAKIEDRHVPFVAFAIIFWMWFLTVDFLYPNWVVFVFLFLKGLFVPGAQPA